MNINMKKAIKPKIGTTAEIASGTLLKATCHPPFANVVTHIKNILALQINKKKTLLYKSVPQKTPCSCGSLLKPFVISPIMKAKIPIAISPNDQVFIFPETSNCSLIDAIVIYFDCSLFFNYLVAAGGVVVAAAPAAGVAVLSVAAPAGAAAFPASCFPLI